MSDKTLVERLRDEAKRAREERGLPVYTPDQLESIADTIEREYLPRPRFEDDEPVQFGDEVFIPCAGRDFAGEVCEITFDGEEYRLKNTDGHIVRFAHWERVKRPEPEVLDAEGVPIRVGDTVWCIERVFSDDCECEVVDVQPSIERAIIRRTLGGAEAIATPINNLTHKQPDSLESIEADARKNPYDYWGCGGASCLNCPAKKDGKEPRERYGTHSCNQAMKLDLLRRQREVLERER